LQVLRQEGALRIQVVDVDDAGGVTVRQGEQGSGRCDGVRRAEHGAVGDDARADRYRVGEASGALDRLDLNGAGLVRVQHREFQPVHQSPSHPLSW
jgi:hypothetical protein